ncbi:MFS transporter [Rhodococcus opacus]|uniref:MFS transporter n=1 Tax=Rhodococcus opacus TaxID=37919 RepID=UPI00130018C4|nr:MFS transporter [Rhodococcus opacus]
MTIAVLATVVLYYQLYLSGGVAVDIIADYGLTFKWFVFMNVAALVVAGVAAHLGGVTDRVGRANVVTIGLVIVGLISAVAIPMCGDRWSFATCFVLLNAAEGVILVATPALVRDFSPQLGRASAMGFWTMGPVLGSLVVTAVVGSGSNAGDWQSHYVVAGICGIVVAALSVPFLKELAPALRDQVMIEARDRALLEARVKGMDTEQGLERPTREMLKPDIVLSSVAISMFLLFYMAMVGFGPTYFEVTFGYSQAQANNVLVWAWAANIAGLMIAGFASDRLLVRKPFMLVGSAIALVVLVVFISLATRPETSYVMFVAVLVVMFFATGAAYVAWMAAYTETVERRNPALTATGLAVWGVIIRFVFAAFVFLAPFVVNTVSTIVDHGAAVAAIAGGQSLELTDEQNQAVAAAAADGSIAERMDQLRARYPEAVETLSSLPQAARAALDLQSANPEARDAAVAEIVKATGVSAESAGARLALIGDLPAADMEFLIRFSPLADPDVAAKLAYVAEHGADVQAAIADGPAQWQRYFWIAAFGMGLFIPMIWLMAGHWSPREARKALRDHEIAVGREMAKVAGGDRDAVTSL